jgi:hypothetical protein
VSRLKRAWSSDLLALGAMGLGVTLLYASVISGKRTLFGFQDGSFQTYAWYSYEARVGSVWDPYQWGGHSFIGELITALFYPFNQLLFLVTGEGITGRGMTAFLLAHAVLAAVLMYAFLRVLRIARPGAVVGALAWALGGYMVHRLTAQADIYLAAVWVPAAFACFHLALERALWIAAPAGAALALSLLAGHVQPAVYCVLALGLYGAYHAATSDGRGRATLRAAAAFAIALAMAGSLAAVQLIPTFEYQENALRSVGLDAPVPADAELPYELVGHHFLLEPGQLDAFLSPNFDDVDDGLPYIGVFTLLLAAIGVARAPRRWAVFWGGLTLLALLYASGHHGGVHRVAYELVPMLDKLREPVRALMLVHFGLAVLAAYGAARLFERAPRVRPGPLALRLGLGAVGAAAAGYAFVKAVDGEPVASREEAARIAIAIAVAGGALVAGRLLGWVAPAAVAVLCAGIVMLDLVPVGSGRIPLESDYNATTNYSPHRYYRETDVLRFLQAQQGEFRVSNPAGRLPPNIGHVYEIQMLQGHGASMTDEAYALLNTGGAPPSPVHDLLNVRYAVTEAPVDEWREVLVSNDQQGRVSENPAPLPRAWLVRDWEVVPDWRAALGRAVDPRFPRREAAVLESAPDVPARRSGPTGEARVVSYEPTEVVFETDAPAPAVLVASELVYPGWTAEVDGDEVPIRRADGVLRSVEVPAGTHRVTMTYRPTHWTLALVLTLGSLAVLVGLCAAAWLRHRRGRA